MMTTTDGITLTQAELARELEVSVATIARWRDTAGLPFSRDGRNVLFRLRDVFAWLARRADDEEAETEAAKNGGAIESWREQRAAIASIRREILELELDRERGRLVTVDLHQRALERILSVVRSEEMKLPGLAPELLAARDVRTLQATLEVVRDRRLSALRDALTEEMSVFYEEETTE